MVGRSSESRGRVPCRLTAADAAVAAPVATSERSGNRSRGRRVRNQRRRIAELLRRRDLGSGRGAATHVQRRRRSMEHTGGRTTVRPPQRAGRCVEAHRPPSACSPRGACRLLRTRRGARTWVSKGPSIGGRPVLVRARGRCVESSISSVATSEGSPIDTFVPAQQLCGAGAHRRSYSEREAKGHERAAVVAHPIFCQLADSRPRRSEKVRAGVPNQYGY
jgi:hypothetical protein